MIITRAEDFKGKEIEKLKREYFRQIDANTPEEIKKSMIFNLDNSASFKITITKDKIKKWKLKEWLENYQKEAIVSTAGIRGNQNILYPWDWRYPLNQIGIALASLGKAMVLKENITDRQINKICSGEVRYNTDRYIDIIKRIQAAEGIKTHIPFNHKTSIWMTSFLIFMLDYDGGEYVTSSHSMSSKIATKDLDNQGSQFVPQMSAKFVKKIKYIIKKAEKDGFDIEFSASDSSLIKEDFDGIEMYIDYLKKGIATKENLNLIKNEINNNFKIIYECVGGCMYNIMFPIFKKLEIENAFWWNNIEEDPFYHGIGKSMLNPLSKKKEFFDYGTDTTRREIIKTLGYESLLKDKPQGSCVIMVDPDGDRIVLGQIESAKKEQKINALGISYIKINNEKIFTFYTPNQSFLLIMNFHSSQLQKEKLWNRHLRFIIMTTPSAASWIEWAKKMNVNVIYVPVGFKEIANIMKKVERQIIKYPKHEVVITDIFSRKVNLGIQPRLLFAGEESGGMIIGPEELIKSKKGRIAIAMREKSAGESSIIVAAMMAKLHKEKKMLSDYLEEIFNKYKIEKKYDIRKDIIFYNESEPNPEKLKKTKAEGERKRDITDSFFLSIALCLKNKDINIKQAKEILSEALPQLNFNNLKNIFFVGDGTYFDFTDKFVEIRKSGTDAIIKGYSAGEDKNNCKEYATTIASYNGNLTPKFKKYISMKVYKTCQKTALRILREFQIIS